MQIFFLSPSYKSQITAGLERKLREAGQVIVVDRKIPFEKLAKLRSTQEKIIALDPLFCNWHIPNKTIADIQNLKAICLMTASYGWIDGRFCKEKSIPVTNVRGFHTEAVADWAILMARNVARRIPLVIKSGWKQDYGNLSGVELNGKVAGIIGMGNVGVRIAEKCQASGMRVQY